MAEDVDAAAGVYPNAQSEGTTEKTDLDVWAADEIEETDPDVWAADKSEGVYPEGFHGDVPGVTEEGAVSERPALMEGYEVVDLLGEGSSGKVFHIRHVENRALKVLECRNDEEYERACREKKAMEELQQCRHIIHLYGAEEKQTSGGRRIFLLEEKAEPLDVHEPRTYKEIFEILQSTGEALKAMEKRGLLHLDVKPQNIFRDEQGVWKLGDFSHTRKLEELAEEKNVIGTMAYMDPEIVRSQRYGSTADLYSLGIVMFRLLSGGEKPAWPKAKVRSSEDVLQASIPVPTELVRIFRKMTAYDPGRRIPSAEEFLQELDQAWTAVLEQDPGFEDRICMSSFTRKAPEQRSEDEDWWKNWPDHDEQVGQESAGKGDLDSSWFYDYEGDEVVTVNLPGGDEIAEEYQTLSFACETLPGKKSKRGDEPERDQYRTEASDGDVVMDRKPPKDADPKGMEPEEDAVPKGMEPPGDSVPTGMEPPGESDPTGMEPPGESNPTGMESPGESVPTGMEPPENVVPMGTKLPGDGAAMRKRPLEPDRVEYAAVVPVSLYPDEYAMIQVIMYEEQFRSMVEEAVQASLEEARKVQGSLLKVDRESRVRIELFAKQMGYAEHQEAVWEGGHLNFYFDVILPEGFSGRSVLFEAVVYIDGIRSSFLKFQVKIGGGGVQNPPVERKDVRSVFMSYASQDRKRVSAIVQGIHKVRPEMDIFWDVESLRSGQSWEAELYRAINSRDTLFLCWSHFARQSEWVEREWRYAYSQRGISGIEPVPLETPDICPPPRELSSMHFSDRELNYRKVSVPLTGEDW